MLLGSTLFCYNISLTYFRSGGDWLGCSILV
jgi:hypothetical protein